MKRYFVLLVLSSIFASTASYAGSYLVLGIKRTYSNNTNDSRLETATRSNSVLLESGADGDTQLMCAKGLVEKFLKSINTPPYSEFSIEEIEFASFYQSGRNMNLIFIDGAGHRLIGYANLIFFDANEYVEETGEVIRQGTECQFDFRKRGRNVQLEIHNIQSQRILTYGYSYDVL